MAKEPYPSETADRYIVRFPDGMRERLKQLAADNGRSLNSEIIHRLQTTLEMDAYVASENAQPEERAPERKADIRIELDTNGIPVSAQEAMMHLNNLVHKANLETISIEMDIGMLKDSRTPEQREDDIFRILSTYRAMREAEEK